MCHQEILYILEVKDSLQKTKQVQLTYAGGIQFYKWTLKSQNKNLIIFRIKSKKKKKKRILKHTPNQETISKTED